MKNRKGQRRYGRGRGLAGLALAGAVAALAGCTSKNVDDRPPVAAVEGPLGAYEETLVCGMGRSTIANPKFPQDYLSGLDKVLGQKEEIRAFYQQ